MRQDRRQLRPWWCLLASAAVLPAEGSPSSGPALWVGRAGGLEVPVLGSRMLGISQWHAHLAGCGEIPGPNKASAHVILGPMSVTCPSPQTDPGGAEG